jgi:hypothetical protein
MNKKRVICAHLVEKAVKKEVREILAWIRKQKTETKHVSADGHPFTQYMGSGAGLMRATIVKGIKEGRYRKEQSHGRKKKPVGTHTKTK